MKVVQCDECGADVDLTEGEVYMEGVLIGAECTCGYWQSEYVDAEGNILSADTLWESDSIRWA